MSSRAAPVAAPKAAPAPATAGKVPARVAVQTPPEPSADTVSRRLQGGHPLPATTRERMERAFGRGFDAVRVHTDAAGAQVAEAHGAEALTLGERIAFGPGRYRPGTGSGDRLIAHELAHVVQQQGGGGTSPQASSLISSSSEPAELAADRAAERVMAGRSAGLSASGLSTRGRLMRRARAGISTLPALSLTPPLSGLRTHPESLALSPVTSAVLSPAGNRLPAVVGAAPSRDAANPVRARPGPARSLPEPPRIKAPDEAQTAIAPAAASPPSVTRAGAPAGAAAEAAVPAPAPARELEARAQARRDRVDARMDQEGRAQAQRTHAMHEAVDGARARSRGGAGGGARRFGRIPGDRGAAAAREAAERLQTRAAAMQHHEPAARRVADARRAARPPANEGSSRAQGRQVGSVAAAEPPAPDAEQARQRVRAAVEAAAPANMDEMDRMGEDEGSARIGEALTGAIGAQAQGVRRTLDAVNDPPPAASTTPAVPQPAPEAAPATSAPALASAAPPPVPDSALDATEFAEDADQALSAHYLDEETLSRAQEGPLLEIAGERQTLDEQVEQASEQARATEGAALEQARAELDSGEQTAQGVMDRSRETAEREVLDEQSSTREGEERDRGTAADRIEAIYRRTTRAVDRRLDNLTDQSLERFNRTQETALRDFNRRTRSDLNWFKLARYAVPVVGPARLLHDLFVSINELPEVQAIYRRNREAYIQRIDTEIEQITGAIDDTITECRELLESARDEIQTLVDSLPADRQAEARAAQERVERQFQRLERRIDEAGESARNALADARRQAIEAVDQALATIQSENQSLVERIRAAVQRLADAVGRFMQLLADITKLGVGAFLSAALGQAGEGVRNHLWDALKEAFKEWLFSRFAFLQPLLNLPPNWLEMLTAFAMNLPQLFMEHLPLMLPGIAIAAMTWLAINIPPKFIPGAGAIMVVIDGIRAAVGLAQQLLSSGEAFFQFAQRVAAGANAARPFATALARAMVAGLGAVLALLGADRLIRRIGRALGPTFGGIIRGISQRFQRRRGRERQQRRQQEDRDRQERQRDEQREGRREDGAAANERRRARDEARRERRDERRRREDGQRRRAGPPRQNREDAGSRDPAVARRRQEQDRERRHRERMQRARRELPPKIRRLLARRPSRIRVRAQLAIWRLRYRLSALSLERRTGASLSFVARASAPIDLGDGWEFNEVELMNAVDRVAEVFIREAERSAPPLYGSASEEHGSAHDPIPLHRREGLGRTAFEAQRRSSETYYQVGTQDLGGGRSVGLSVVVRGSGYRDTRRGPGGQFIPPRQGTVVAGRPTGEVLSYVDIQERLRGVDVGDALWRLQMRRPLAGLSRQQAEAASELHFLWFGHEPSPRGGTHRRDLVYSAMVAQMMGEGRSLDEAMTVHPSVQQGAQQGARLTTGEMRGVSHEESRNPYTRNISPQQARDERMRREMATIQQWFRGRQKPILRRPPTPDDVRSFVELELRAYFSNRRASYFGHT